MSHPSGDSEVPDRYQYSGPGGTWAAWKSGDVWLYGTMTMEIAGVANDRLKACDQAQNAAKRIARCHSCEHLMEFHQPDGCWYAVVVGRQDQSMGCPCGVPYIREDIEE